MEKLCRENLVNCIGGSATINYIKSFVISFINVIKAVKNVRSKYSW
ncbi:MAG: hypothetical protein NC483_02610 [Ruminococcus sp.]|nr:hypothetical protein [Ruminococcus sp.]